MRSCPSKLPISCTRVLWAALVAALCTCACRPAVAQQTARLTLDDVLRLANQNNLDLVAARARRAAALAGIAIAKERPNPTVSFGAARDVPHESVLLDQPFELGLKRAKRI